MKRSESRTSQAGKNRESSGEVHDRMQALGKQQQEWDEKRELRKELQMQVDERQKQLTTLNAELKTKQSLLSKIKQSGSNFPLIEERDKKIDELNGELVMMHHELAQFKQMKAQLENVKVLQKENKDQAALIEELKSKMENQASSIGAWLSTIDEQKKSLKQKMEIIDQLNTSIEKNDVLQDHLRITVKQKEDVNNSLFSKQKEHKNEIDGLKKQVAELKKINETQVADLAKEHKETLDKIHEQRQKLDKEQKDKIATYQDRIEFMETESKNKIAVMNKVLDEERAHNLQLKKELTDTKEQNAELKSELSVIKNNMAEKVRILTQTMEDQVSNMQKQLGESNRIRDQAVKDKDVAEGQLSTKKERITGLEKGVNASKEQLIGINKQFKEFREKEMGSDALQINFVDSGKNAEFWCKSDPLITELQQTQQIMTNHISEFCESFNLIAKNEKESQNRIRDFVRQVRELDQEMAQLKSGSDQQVKQLEQAKKILADKYFVLEQAHAKLKEDRDAVIEKLKKEHQAAMVDLVAGHNVHLNKIGDDHEESQSQLKEKLKDLQNEIELLQKRIEQQKAESDQKLQQHLSELQKKINQQLAESAQMLQTQKVESEAKMKVFKEEMDAKTKRYKSELELAKKEITDLNTKNSDLQSKNTALSEKIALLKEQIGEIKKQLGQALQKKIQSMEQQVKASESEIEVLKEMVKGSKMQIKSKDTDIQRLTLKTKRLEKQTETIREQTIREVTEKLNSGQAAAASPTGRVYKRSSPRVDGSTGAASSKKIRQESDGRSVNLPPISKPKMSMQESQNNANLEGVYVNAGLRSKNKRNSQMTLNHELSSRKGSNMRNIPSSVTAMKVTDTPDITSRVNLSRVKNAQSHYQQNYPPTKVATSVTELSVGVPASLEPPTLHNDLERIQVPRQQTASRVETTSKLSRPPAMEEMTLNKNLDMVANSSKNSKSRRFDKHIPATRSESALLPDDNEEEGSRTLDDVYQVRATPKSKVELISLKSKNLQSQSSVAHTENGYSQRSLRKDKGEEALKELIAQQSEMKRELGLD